MESTDTSIAECSDQPRISSQRSNSFVDPGLCFGELAGVGVGLRVSSILELLDAPSQRHDSEPPRISACCAFIQDLVACGQAIHYFAFLEDDAESDSLLGQLEAELARAR